MLWWSYIGIGYTATRTSPTHGGARRTSCRRNTNWRWTRQRQLPSTICAHHSCGKGRLQSWTGNWWRDAQLEQGKSGFQTHSQFIPVVWCNPTHAAMVHSSIWWPTSCSTRMEPTAMVGPWRLSRSSFLHRWIYTKGRQWKCSHIVCTAVRFMVFWRLPCEEVGSDYGSCCRNHCIVGCYDMAQ